METGVNPVVGGGPAGWVSGNPAGLADGASVSCLFDLGPEWDQYLTVMLMFRPVGATSLSGVLATGRDDPVAATNVNRYLRDDALGTATILYATVQSANAGGVARVHPAGRYLVVTCINTAGSGAMGASKITLAAYPA